MVRVEENTENTTQSALVAKVTIPINENITGMKNIEELKTVNLRCGESTFDAIIDSGAQISVIREELVKNEPSEGYGSIKIVSAFGEVQDADVRTLKLKINDKWHDYFPITCAISKKLANDMLICPSAYDDLLRTVQFNGNINEIIAKLDTNGIQTIDHDKDTITEEDELNGNTPDNKINTDENEAISDSRTNFINLQKSDDELKTLWELAKKKKNSFNICDGVLTHSEIVCGERIEQVVLPQCKRKKILRIAHDIPLAGHLGEQKTRQRIKYAFYWPNIKSDVKEYCESCHVCQVRKRITYRDRIPIQPIVRPENPFEVWSIDCIGPLVPNSRRGHKYIICAIDLCTRWAEAIPVSNINAKTTCNSLMKIFTQTGFPRVICTDQGSNFTAELTKTLWNIIGVEPRFATPGHPESMGAVERWNKTLKDMINKNIQENGTDWDLYLPYLLFAYREVPHCTTGISPYQMVYGRIPVGPLSLLKDVWLGNRKIPTTNSISVEKYLSDITERFRKAYEIATENTNINQARYVSYYNLRSKDKQFDVGDKVLILLPSSTHKLPSTWIGPATIIKLTRPHSALVEMEDGSRRELHFNKLRPYIARVNNVGVIFEEDEDFGDIHYTPSRRLRMEKNDINSYINELQIDRGKQQDLKKIIYEYADIFSKIPGIAKVEGHSVKVNKDCQPKKLPPYRVPIVMQKEVDRQIQELLELGLIKHSKSEWAHPVVCVAKKDGSVRLCIDFRLLNKFTIPDAYPMKLADELRNVIGAAQIISVLDLTKGYWQIPMEEDSKHYTAFVTHSGHYQWEVMPFGMKNAGSTFQRSMDKILETHKDYCRSYIDDVAIFSQNWEDHIKHIRLVLGTIQSAGLTVNLKKCNFGQRTVKFLGYIIGSGTRKPDPEKIEAIKNLSKPKTKRDLRSILGLANYYREHITNFAKIALPLTELTKKRVSNNLPWTDVHEKAFQDLKQQLAEAPELYTPQIGKPFQLFTDASNYAIGACLSQLNEKGKECPIAFYSKKLTPCQMKWSTIEKEAYSVLAALRKFDTWIFGADIEVVSDHNPLTYLTKTMPQGAKLARWALALQRYNLKITYRKGKKHGNADALSRLPQEFEV